MTAATPHQRIDLLCYSLLSFPLLFVGLSLYVFAPEFYTTQYGVSLTTIGAILLVLRVIDGVQDLWIGYLSDRYHRHRPLIMIIGALILGVGFWWVFHPSPQMPLFSFCLGILLSVTGFSILSINYKALGALWRADESERTRITSWREAVGLLGLLSASIAPSLFGRESNPAQAFHWLAVLFVPMLAYSMYLFYQWMRSATLEMSSRTQPQRFARLNTAWNRQFLAIFTLNTFAGAIPAVLVLFFINDRLEASAYTGMFLILYFLSGACAMPLWQLIAKRVGKSTAWMLSMIAAACGFFWAFTLGAGDIVAYSVICVLSGMALGADLALPPSILADRIAHEQDHDMAAYYFSATTFLSKTALALATGITLPLLGLLGYQPGEFNSASVTLSLAYSYALFPSIGKLAAALWLWSFTHTHST